MNFNAISNLVKNAAPQLGGNSEPPQQQASPDQTQQQPHDQQAPPAAQATTEHKWNDVGAAAKDAVSTTQARQARGEAVDYKQIGGVVQKAAAAYNNNEGPRDAASIGKLVSAGFMSGGAAAKKEAQSAPVQHTEQPPQQQQSE